MSSYARVKSTDPDYPDILRLAARDYFDRGWVTVPIQYGSDGAIYPPSGYLDWVKSKPCLDNVIGVMNDYEPDAIAILAGSTDCVWLDVDDRRDITKLDKRLSLPTYSTRRGEHRIFRPTVAINKSIDLRKGGMTGEIRAGDNLSIVPPSKSRHSSRIVYRWINPLPIDLADIPTIVPRRLFPSRESYLRNHLNSNLVRCRTTKPQRGLNSCKVEVEHSYVFGGERQVDVLSHLPNKPGNRLKMLPGLMTEMMNFKGNWSDAEIEDIGNRWYWAAKDRRVTKAKNAKSTISALLHLRDTFDRTLSRVILQAECVYLSSLEELDISTLRIRQASFRVAVGRVAKLCRALDHVLKGQPFFLGLRDAGRITGIKNGAARRALGRLCEEGWIQCLDPGTPGKATGGDAATFRWLIDK